MTSNITTTRQMRGSNLTVEDFRNLFEGAAPDAVPTIRVNDGDRFGAPTTTVTVAVVSGGTRASAQDSSEPFGNREATR
jgi:hypothetical protein